jgi:TRAP-type C4-dicarboxylate transport system substrate-binding protein
MTNHRRLASLALLGALLSGCSSSTNKATGARDVEPVTLTLANPYPGDAQIGEWVHAVERRSRGAVQIEVRGDWRTGELDADRAMLRDVRSGRVDVAHIPAYAWDTLGVRSFQALVAPLLVDSLELQERVVTGELGATMLEGVRAAGVEPVGLLPGPLKRPVGITRDLQGPEDYGGAVMALRPSGVHEAAFRALGARTVHRALFRALPSGSDGSEGDLYQLDGEPFRGQVRNMTTNVVLWPRPKTLVMNPAAWEELTAGQRALLTDAVRAAVAPMIEQERTLARGGLEVACENRLSLIRASAAQVASLRRAVDPVYSQIARDPAARRVLDGIRALKADSPAEPAPACNVEQAPSMEPGAAPLVGSWRVEATRELLAAARREPGEAVEANWGNITLVLGGDGKFEMLNDRFPGQVQGIGTWSAHGDVLELVPGGSVDMGAGETWRYRWTLFRGSLELGKLSVGPTSLTVAPLRRR